MQQVMLLGMQQISFRTRSGIKQQSSQFGLVWHQFIQRESVNRGMSRLEAHAPATVSGYGIKPNGKSMRVLNFGQVPEGAKKNFLHGIFGVLRVAADLHAERINSVLKQSDLYQCMAQIAQLRFLAVALLVQPRVGVGGRCVRLV